MRWKKLTAAFLSAVLLNSCTAVSAFAHVPLEAETEEAELVEPENPVHITEDVNADAETGSKVVKADGDPGEPLTPEGTLTLEDDIITESGKQFITVTSRDGHYYYLIIDRSNKEKNNVYFLSAVDERDLLTLMNDKDREALEKEQQEEAERKAKEEAEKKAAEEAERKAAEKEAKRQQEAAATAEKAGRPITIAGHELTPEMLGAIAALAVLTLLGTGAAAFFRKKRNEQALPDPDSEYEDDYDDKYDLEEGEDDEDERDEEAEFYGEDEETGEP